MNYEKIISDISNTVNQSRQLDAATIFTGPKPDKPFVQSALENVSAHLQESQRERINQEFSGEGPLSHLLNDHEIIEIMITSKEDIWFEKKGVISKAGDCFLSDLTFNNFFHRLCDETKVNTNFAFPFANGFWKNFRIHITTPPVTTQPVITLRRLKTAALSLETLRTHAWCTTEQEQKIKKSVKEKKNILVLGNTGSGKTTLINALLNEANSDRSIIIEDTSEILAPNSLCVKMLTRFDSQGQLPEITQADLVKQSLRMRPDRLIIGEIRGPEAKDLLMALSTGHKGSISSIHAHSASEALLRLEMLIQMGAPQWNLEAIRRLIHLCVDELIVTQKKGSRWFMEGRYKIASLEKFGFLVESLD